MASWCLFITSPTRKELVKALNYSDFVLRKAVFGTQWDLDKKIMAYPYEAFEQKNDIYKILFGPKINFFLLIT